MSTWYGTTAAWWVPLERDARRRFGPTMRYEYGRHRLTYWIHDLEIVADPAPAKVEIQFFAEPDYKTWGQEARNFPRVFAKPGASSPHRHPDDALCLWYPIDPPEMRWTSDKGLLDLIEITRRHLFLENYWRETDIWLLPDAEHGFPKRR